MDYELAKKLKDAGFPQNGCENYYEGSTEGVTNVSSDYFNGGYNQEIYCAAPTLSELIEACGEDFKSLETEDGKWWYATAGDWEPHLRVRRFSQGGPDAETAVARLWLALHSKD